MFIEFFNNKKQARVAFRKSGIIGIALRYNPQFKILGEFSVVIKNITDQYTVCHTGNRDAALRIYRDILKSLNSGQSNKKYSSIDTDF